MAIKKSELYSSLWASCDELRGGMDASQYKDYVLTMLFVKYISDKYRDKPFGAITVPQGASFDDMVALIGTPNIGDDINKKILNPIKEANRLSDFPDFNDENKLGKGKDLIDTVGNLILIFNDPKLNFSTNNAEGDDILGDAYEYLMRHFATESGKSKGQFYTPSEVSRVIAKVIGINSRNATTQTTAYDPTCGSGSLLLKVMNEAGKNIELYGQEKETATAGLARMNMILHHAETAEIVADNTLTKPAFKTGDALKKFDYIVANPPFSLKSWSNGLSTVNDEFHRFELGVPPEKNGDYAFLLHIIASLKSTGKAAVVLPHGVLFRGNTEGDIRKRIIQKGYIKAIIGLPANLFYGTGIPACILVLDKEHAQSRKGIFMVDASKGFVKDGPKNRLREQDIRKITDVFSGQLELPKYSRIVPLTEITGAKNDYNLNIPRYIDTQESEDIQDIAGHLLGGIPDADVEALNKYWMVYPALKEVLFKPLRTGYFSLQSPAADIRDIIFNHPQFIAFNVKLQKRFDTWLHKEAEHWKSLKKGFHPKDALQQMSDELLKNFADNTLIDAYDMYQQLMNYWAESMQDDFYSISLDGWAAGKEYSRIIIKGKKGKDGKTGKDKTVQGLEGIEGRMISPQLMIAHFFALEKKAIDKAQTAADIAKLRMDEIEGEQCGEDGLFSELEKVNAAEVKRLLATKAKDKKANGEDLSVLHEYLELAGIAVKAIKEVKELTETLETIVIAQYPKLDEKTIRQIVVHEKWEASLQIALHSLQDRISQALSRRVRELAERYDRPLPELELAMDFYEQKVKQHLATMGF
ncbi:type I restriction-modification system subunit M [Mucilaginibacter calamicampi]|uniref:site-specific DNA-methyltransferase (adenine-specific) n=1 Tax=Mucilaginibacter calamicampi TaxID=1302352 RepID=A0ABW2YZG8_9SPHI